MKQKSLTNSLFKLNMELTGDTLDIFSVIMRIRDKKKKITCYDNEDEIAGAVMTS